MTETVLDQHIHNSHECGSEIAKEHHVEYLDYGRELVQSRDYQNRIVSKVINEYHNGTKTVGIMSPTGSGKTVIAMRICNELSKEKDLKINWVAMRRTLLRQAAEMNQKFFGMENMSFVSMFNDRPPKADIVILDECQHAATSSFIHIDTVSNPDVIIGLSATPFRTDKLKLPFERMIQDAGIHRLIQEKWLPPYHHYIVDQFTPKRVAEIYSKDIDRWGKSIFFFHTIDQCNEFNDEISKNGIRGEVVTGSMHNAKRDDILDEFNEGKLNVVSNVAVLTEGFDAPSLKTVWTRDSARLPTIQMAGRGFRPHDGKSHCNIVQSKNTYWQFSRTAKPEMTFIYKYDDWYSIGTSEAVEDTIRSILPALSQAEVSMPTFITNNRKKKRKI